MRRLLHPTPVEGFQLEGAVLDVKVSSQALAQSIEHVRGICIPGHHYMS
jgi:hypothetical protein